MILHSDCTSGGEAGFTLLEALITLSILSLATAVSIAAIKGPSPELQLQRLAADLQVKAGLRRHLAVQTRKAQTWDIGDLGCSYETAEVLFFPNGSARGPDICLAVDDKTLRLHLSPLIGQYASAEREE